MFNTFGKKDEPPRNEPRSSVNVTPGLGGANPPARPQPQPAAVDSPRPDLRFAETPKAQQQQAQPREEQPAGSRLIVGPDIKLKGVEITDCDTLVVEGRVEASMDSRVIQIAENGVFSGTVSIDVAEIRGRFEGELVARKQLVIYSTGHVSGHIRYGKIRIEEGGELSGDVSMIAKPAPAAYAPVQPAAPTAATPAAATPAAPSAPAAPAPAAAAAAAASAPAPAPSTLSRAVQAATGPLSIEPQTANASREQPRPAKAGNSGGGKTTNVTV